MAEYIEREAALGLIDRYWQQAYNAHFLDAAVRLGSVYREMEEIPAADVRPVVLCRDCDCWNEWDSAGRESLGNYVCSCAHWSVEDGPILYTRPTDFCSYGEKREES